MSELTPLSPSPGVPVVGKIRREQKQDRGQKKQKAEDEELVTEPQRDQQPIQHIDEIV
ncbi:MAG: hypothetical protein M0R33_11760 [Methylomonas sp.]|uniref:hypothetical protein n=1 Tax=Methylomonas sp. TaxID=418 RepID=UPI0025FE4CC4|nr:hypothetical protein [Methylomonas sp.]MCK9607111.1 hypothetical protein [Methylomonas sp.]